MSTATIRRSTKIPQPAEAAPDGKAQYPGIPTTCDGAEAVVHVEIHVAQAPGLPITSSTTMGGGFNAAYQRRQEPVGRSTDLLEPGRASHSAATVCEGLPWPGPRDFNVDDRFSAVTRRRYARVLSLAVRSCLGWLGNLRRPAYGGRAHQRPLVWIVSVKCAAVGRPPPPSR